MSDVPARVRADIYARSEGRCEFVAVQGGGRCVNAADDAHHVVLRSRGGNHSEDNLAHVCRSCHMCVHHQAKPFYDGPFYDNKGRTYYTYDAGGANVVEKAKLYFWYQIEADMRDRAADLDSQFKAEFRISTVSQIRLARTLAEMDRFSLFALTNGEPEDAREYCAMIGIDNPSTVRNYLSAGSVLLDSPKVYDAICAYNDRCNEGEEFTWSMLRSITATIRNKPEHDQLVAINDVMAQRMAGAPGDECVKQIRPTQDSEWEVTGLISASPAAVTLTVKGADAEAAWRAFERRVTAQGDLRDIVHAQRQRVRKS